MSMLNLLPINGSPVVNVTVDRLTLPPDIEEQIDLEGTPKTIRYVRDGVPMTFLVYPDHVEVSLSRTIKVALGVNGNDYTMRLS